MARVILQLAEGAEFFRRLLIWRAMVAFAQNAISVGV